MIVYAYFAAITFGHKNQFNHGFITALAVFSGLLAIHWSTYPLLYFFPQWYHYGFVLGTTLNTALYISLLICVFLSFQQRLQDAEAKALKLAYHDPLTGLKNKLYMNTIFEHAVMLANRPHQLMAVIYIDLDNFKPINDKDGHKMGDHVLKIVANRIRQNARSTDICLRVGGDEFIVIATQLESETEIHTIAKKLIKQITEPLPIQNKTYNIGASIGISIYPTDGTDISHLVEQADAAMYRVKREGKTGYAIHGDIQVNLDLKNRIKD